MRENYPTFLWITIALLVSFIYLSFMFIDPSSVHFVIVIPLFLINFFSVKWFYNIYHPLKKGKKNPTKGMVLSSKIVASIVFVSLIISAIWLKTDLDNIDDPLKLLVFSNIILVGISYLTMVVGTVFIDFNYYSPNSRIELSEMIWQCLSAYTFIFGFAIFSYIVIGIGAALGDWS